MILEEHMTRQTHSVRATASLQQASDLMAEHGVRHLPVLDGGQLRGIISDRDIALMRSFRDVDLDEVTVEDACTQDVYVVSPKEPLKNVVARMGEAKIGCAVVLDANGRLQGIFTTTDACRVLAELLSS